MPPAGPFPVHWETVRERTVEGRLPGPTADLVHGWGQCEASDSQGTHGLQRPLPKGSRPGGRCGAVWHVGFESQPLSPPFRVQVGTRPRRAGARSGPLPEGAGGGAGRKCPPPPTSGGVPGAGRAGSPPSLLRPLESWAGAPTLWSQQSRHWGLGSYSLRGRRTGCHAPGSTWGGGGDQGQRRPTWSPWRQGSGRPSNRETWGARVSQSPHPAPRAAPGWLPQGARGGARAPRAPTGF